MNILDYIDNRFKPRDGQIDLLNWVEANWDKYDVFLIEASVSFGKSLISQTISKYASKFGFSSAILCPSNILLNQYTETFSTIPSLKGLSKYMCKKHKDMTCFDVNMAYDHRCKDCQYTKDKLACSTAQTSIYNYYSFFVNQTVKDVLVIDEAHNVFSMLQEMSSISFWKHKEDHYGSMKDVNDFIKFLEYKRDYLISKTSNFKGKKSELARLKNQLRKIWMIYDNITLSPNEFSFAIEMKPYKGELKECASICPLSMDNVPSRLFNKRVKKIFLMSATIYKDEINLIGLRGRRVGIYHGESPIPKENRPFIYIPVTKVSYETEDQAVVMIADAINNLLVLHQEEKGIIHLTYGFAQKLKKHLRIDEKGDRTRYRYFDKDTKQATYEEFIKSDKPLILLAAGLSEGISLDYNLSRFQVICKVVYPSLGDAHINNLMKQNGNYYRWITMRTIIQQTGRVCRTPTDYGVTYMLDSSFAGLYGKTVDFLPKWFKESISIKLDLDNFIETEINKQIEEVNNVI